VEPRVGGNRRSESTKRSRRLADDVRQAQFRFTSILFKMFSAPFGGFVKVNLTLGGHPIRQTLKKIQVRQLPTLLPSDAKKSAVSSGKTRVRSLRVIGVIGTLTSNPEEALDGERCGC
jgi:hypothetical protein